LEIPLHWRAPRLCFVNSGADLFHEDVDFRFLAEIYAHVYLAERHTFQFLTKRPEAMLRWYKGQPQTMTVEAISEIGEKKFHWGWPLLNLWPGVSVESKKYLYRLDLLRQVPAPVRMVSFEPLLEDLGEVNLQGIGWAIVGGESGPGARPMHPDWARSLRDQCVAAGVPFFFKQWGEWAAPFYEGQYSKSKYLWQPIMGERGELVRVGKKKAGRLLDGREWNEFPKPYPGHEVVRLARRKAA
jgi:protein gp37